MDCHFTIIARLSIRAINVKYYTETIQVLLSQNVGMGTSLLNMWNHAKRKKEALEDRNICLYKLAPYDDIYLGKVPKLAKKSNRTLDKFTILEYCNR